MQQKWIDAYMDTAERFAQLSSAKRLHVGAIVVKDDRIISIGYNGMPSGWDNNCEDEITPTLPYLQGDSPVLKSKPEVLHAETNAIAKLAKSNESGLGATMFITHAPCLDCAKLIYQSGISSVLYRDSYRDNDGLNMLRNCNVEVKKYLTNIQN
jgi:dCMP deaminase